ncbi:hypothetical protein PSMK_22030 [Phycisphaera mikurensis NBRC 102666]|uniref:Uncharacterized protein n=1 Tax=Phycisphaera mikurensis (strain NBRC 102666 / KCTC 22515 / FYK2301M01) TaxID=1142394 RepID=I0IGH4_PHYMF|nr:hypothetical protein PSMK_22030 [Phycisphaera mikurensis NBRC 102666]
MTPRGARARCCATARPAGPKPPRSVRWDGGSSRMRCARASCVIFRSACVRASCSS